MMREVVCRMGGLRVREGEGEEGKKEERKVR
jgi:hypothetical protein